MSTTKEPSEVVTEDMTLHPSMSLEFYMAEDEKGKPAKGAMLRFHSSEPGAPEDEVFTAPNVAYLLELAGHMLLRTASSAHERSFSRAAAVGVINLGDVIRDLFGPQGPPQDINANGPRKES